jgi:hypothetical protein
MNNANLAVRERTAVNLVNATILLLQLKTKCYNEYKAKTWNLNEVLTPHGKKLSEYTLKDVNHREYKIHINHRVISGSVVCKGCHQPANTNAISKQKRMKDQYLEGVPVVDPKLMASLVFTWWLWLNPVILRGIIR